MRIQQRLLGIDLFRGIAVYGVVILHSDSGIEQLPWLWQLIRQLFAFAVPFFLAVSFYFAVAKSQQGKLNFQARLKRLLSPYLIWTLLYLLYKACKYILDNELERLETLFQDPFTLIFCGGAAFHLYFLPLLLWGICLVKILEFRLFKQMNFLSLIFFLIICSVINNLIVISGNGFKLNLGMAFTSLGNLNDQALIRLLLLLLAWTTWCLPYILISKIILYPQIDKLIRRLNHNKVIWLIVAFILLALLDFWWQPTPLSELLRGYIVLLISIYSSQQLQPRKWLLSLGSCSFGIYLLHLVFVESFYIVGNRFYADIFQQPPILLLVAIATIAFLLSWIVTLFLLGYSKSTSLIFGT